MGLTKEDVLRELELLPVWRAQSTAVNASLAQTENVAIEPMPTVMTSSEPAPIEPAPIEPTVATVVDSEPVAQSQPEEMTPIIEKTAVAWMWVSSPIKDTNSQSLFDGMVNAMRLPKNEMVLVSKRSEMAGYQAQRMVLLGLNVANAVLRQSEVDIQMLRGRVHQLDGTHYVATHSLQAMLAQPHLKKEVWQDLCLLMRVS